MQGVNYQRETSAPAPQAPIFCRADGCRNRCVSNGLCLFHGEAKNPASWPLITKIMQTHEFKYLAWYWNELSKYTLPCFVHVEGNTYYTEDLIVNFQKRLYDFGIPAEQLRYLKDSSPRGFAIRMKEKVLEAVLERTGASKDETGADAHDVPMPEWVMPRIRESLKPRVKTWVEFNPNQQPKPQPQQQEAPEYNFNDEDIF